MVRSSLENKQSVNDGESSDAVTMALGALAWSVSEPARADRLLALTGLTPNDLRTRATDPALLGAVIAYLEGYEPDLIACAKALEITPAALVGAGRALA